MLEGIRNRIRRFLRRRQRREPAPTVWYHPDYRIPLEGLGLETRRADLVAWSLLDLGVVDPDQIVRPRRVAYAELAAVHTPNLLETLSDPERLAPVFGATPEELPTENIARTIRLACGATLAAARRATAGAGPQVNLLGGFHHASPDRGGGFSVVNDIAVAIHALRADRFQGTIAVLDLDAHPPDGTADCLVDDPEGMGDVWIGSISGTDWGALDIVDETLLTDADDSRYLATLERLLDRMPKVTLAIILAGGDVLSEDRFGGLAMTVDGAYRRDRMVARHLRDTPSVWLSAGGYSDNAWRVLLNTVASLALTGRLEVPTGYDPLRARFSRLARELEPPRGEDDVLSALDLAEDLGIPVRGRERLLSTYTEEWVEYALHHYGVLDHIRRLGYSRFRIVIDRGADCDRLRLYGWAQDAEHILIEAAFNRTRHAGDEYLFVDWLTLRHPVARFTEARPKLPNQEVPGLGLAREAGEIMGLMAQRLGLVGVAIRPAAFHVAYTARYDFSFADPAREGRFRKLVEDLGHVPLAALTGAISEGRVTLDGEPYQWEPDLMMVRLDGVRTVPAPTDSVFELHEK